MTTRTRLSTKGQLILPKEIRERRGWKPGTELEVAETGDGVLIRPVEHLPVTRLADIVGSTGYRGPTVTLAEMDEAVEREARRRR